MNRQKSRRLHTKLLTVSISEEGSRWNVCVNEWDTHVSLCTCYSNVLPKTFPCITEKKWKDCFEGIVQREKVEEGGGETYGSLVS